MYSVHDSIKYSSLKWNDDKIANLYIFSVREEKQQQQINGKKQQQQNGQHSLSILPTIHI